MTLHMWPGHFVVRGGCANWWYLSARCIYLFASDFLHQAFSRSHFWWYLSARCIYLFASDFLHQAFRDPISVSGISQLAAFLCLHLTDFLHQAFRDPISVETTFSFCIPTCANLAHLAMKKKALGDCES